MSTLSLAPLTTYDWGALFALLVAFTAWRLRWLRLDGALAAFAIGTAVFGSGTWPYALVLLLFFASGTLLGKVPRGAGAPALVDVGKGGARDGAQVLANGAVAAVCALAAHSAAHAHGVWPAAFAGALSAAAADTWATEIGTRWGGAPHHPLTLRPLPAGISGGVTFIGTLGGIAGASAVALAAQRLGIAAFAGVALAGVAGSMLDTLLGASLQAQRRCGQCRELCETDPHRCGAQTTLVRGFPSVDNDMVNFTATLCGAAVAYLLA
ncbi:DUF92 domain-containing protein [bacterium]|nr:MAG: DUF92 domain-containing protein [bacterium]